MASPCSTKDIDEGTAIATPFIVQPVLSQSLGLSRA